MNEKIQKPAWSDWLALGLVTVTAPIFLFPRPGWTWVFVLAPAVWMLLGIILFYSALAVLSSEKVIKTGMIFFLAADSALAVFGIVGIMMVPERPFAKILPGLTKAIPWHNWKLPGAECGINPNALAGSLCFVIPLALIAAMYNYVNRGSEIAG